MTTKTIRRLKITNYKSIDSLELNGLTPFSVFAGPNGSGKSNFFDALDFVRLFILSGIEEALREHGGFASIHSEKRRAVDSGKFRFEIECDLPEMGWADDEGLLRFHYSLTIHDLDQKSPNLEEHVHKNGSLLLSRKKGDDPIIYGRNMGGVLQELFGAAVSHGDAAPPIIAKHGAVPDRSHRRQRARSIGHSYDGASDKRAQSGRCPEAIGT